MAIGVEPRAFPVYVRIDGIDITSTIPYTTMSMEDNMKEVSTFAFTTHNPSGVTPTRGQRVHVIRRAIAGETQQYPTLIFSGYVTRVQPKKIDQGIITKYDVECQDNKILLEKSVVDYTECTGSEADILTCLAASVYPDLTDFFDFGKLVNSVGSDFELTANNDSMLDMIKDLSDKSGQDFTIDQDGETVTFDKGGYGSPAGEPPWTNAEFFGDFIINLTSPSTDAEIFATGNPGYCMRISSAISDPIGGVRVDFRPADGGAKESKTIRDVTFDYYVGADSGTDTLIEISVTGYFAGITVTPDAAWVSVRASEDYPFWSPPYTDNQCIIFFSEDSVDGTSWDYRIDNIHVETDEGYGGAPINFGNLDNSDFNLDVDTSDEYAFDIDLDLGDFDFNSVIMTGGTTDLTIDWTYESDGDMDHFDLETQVDSIAVFKNTNTDASPTWTAQTLGTFGEDELTGDGGSADVLYDTENHWLYFDTSPSNLSKSIRVTGTIRKPVKVRVEDVQTGEPTLAKSFFDDDITNETVALEKGNAILDKRNQIRRLTFKTYNPGLKPGTTMTVVDSSRGLDETLVIQRVNTQWLGSGGSALFDVECGPDEQVSIDRMFANTEKRLTPKPPPAAFTAAVYTLLIDADGDYVIDADSDKILVRND